MSEGYWQPVTQTLEKAGGAIASCSRPKGLRDKYLPHSCRSSTIFKSISSHSVVSCNCMHCIFLPPGLVKGMEIPRKFKPQKTRILLCRAGHWREAVINHNYTSGPACWHPLKAIFECAVVLSALNSVRRWNLMRWCVCMSRVVVSLCDGVPSKPALCPQRLWMYPPASPSSFNGPINWMRLFVKRKELILTALCVIYRLYLQDILKLMYTLSL